MIEAKNKSEFIKILSLIAEEAVHLSKKELNESSDPYVGRYSEQFKSDQKMYGKLSEQDEEEGEEAAAEEDLADLEAEFEEEGGEPGDEDVELEDEEPAPEEGEEGGEEDAVDPSTEEFGVSFDSVLDAINNLRAGRSLKDTNIKDQTSAYYDRLDDPERKVLLVFLKQLSEILNGAVDGSEAQDPGDVNLTVSDASAEDEPEADPDSEAGDAEEEDVITDDDLGGEEPAPEEGLEGEDTEEGEEGEGTEEDTSPPIKVNESQDLENLRKRVRRLMLRG